MPESLRAFWRMVSLTAAKTRRMFEVSVACVRLVVVISERPYFPAPLARLTEGTGSDALD